MSRDDDLRLVDSHCHINCIELAEGDSVDALIERAHKAGVCQMLCVSVDEKHMHEVIELAERYPSVKASVGIHPCDGKGVDFSVEQILEWADHSEVIALGETGLDYYRDPDDKAISDQQAAFRKHIQAAHLCQKPIIVHTRHAKADTIAILQEEKASEVAGVMHCFTEDWAMAKQALDLGFYISISGIVTFKNADVVKDVASKLPSDRLLIETDSPYLAPVPFRGKQNEPAFVRHTAEYLAQLRGVSLALLAEQSSQNYLDLFKLDADLLKR